MRLAHFLVKDRLNRLNGIGFGIQHLPEYVRVSDELHTHDVVEMNYVVRGTGVHFIGDRSFATGPGALGITHYTQQHDIDTGGALMEVINLYLDLERFPLPDLGEDLARPLYQILPLHPSLRHRRNQFVHLQFTPGGEQEGMLWAMLREQERAEPGYREAMRSQLRLFLIACARQATEGSYPLLDEFTEPEAQVEALRRALDADPAQRVSLDGIAARLGWTKPHLCRTFKRHTGASIVEYLIRQRINAAMVRLRSTRDSIVEVALGCGFNDQSFFNRTFRAIAGVTPTAYRRQAGGA